MFSHTTSRHFRLFVRTVALFLAVALCMLPGVAYADDYSIDQVSIDATVNTDGSLDVVEQRLFDFDGSYHGVYWKIPKGSYEGREVEADINQVGEIINGSFVAFDESYSGDDHTYQLSDYGSYLQVKLYSAHSYEDATFVIDFHYTNLAERHDDVSVLYWKFVSDGWDVESRNVTCRVHLPVPEGRKVEPEENVRAWGHGPLDASLAFEGNDVVYQVPGVGTSEFAEARITFPSDWLGNATSVGGRVLQDILDEEQRWADEANARRERARVISYGSSGLGVLGTLATIVLPIISLVRYRRRMKPTFDDEYYRDVPTNDHPAVLGSLYRGGDIDAADYTATLMHLTDMGAIKLELVTLQSSGLFGKVKTRQDYRLTLSPRIESLREQGKVSDIDNKVIRMVFDTIERFSTAKNDSGISSPCIYLSDFEKVAKKHPQVYSDAYDFWTGSVTTAYNKRHFGKSNRGTGRATVIACGTATVVLFMLTVFLLIMEWMPWYVAVPLILLQIGSCMLSVGVAIKLKPFSDEAIEIRAKLNALRRWLKDFTRLNEAVPNDVVLWNKLLVMAVVLGVSEEVIKQLKTAMPEMLNDPYLAPTYAWYYAGPHGSPYQSFKASVAEAHHVSTAALAASSSSSGGGGGGGFSGGGGGGFGGGGGGGAF